MIVKTKLFGGVCKLTLGTSNATWDVDFTGPGVIKEYANRIQICTEFGEATYDKKCVIGYVVSYTKGGMYAPDPDDSEDTGGEDVEV